MQVKNLKGSWKITTSRDNMQFNHRRRLGFSPFKFQFHFTINIYMFHISSRKNAKFMASCRMIKIFLSKYVWFELSTILSV